MGTEKDQNAFYIYHFKGKRDVLQKCRLTKKSKIAKAYYLIG